MVVDAICRLLLKGKEQVMLPEMEQVVARRSVMGFLRGLRPAMNDNEAVSVHKRGERDGSTFCALAPGVLRPLGAGSEYE